MYGQNGDIFWVDWRSEAAKINTPLLITPTKTLCSYSIHFLEELNKLNCITQALNNKDQTGRETTTRAQNLPADWMTLFTWWCATTPSFAWEFLFPEKARNKIWHMLKCLWYCPQIKQIWKAHTVVCLCRQEP